MPQLRRAVFGVRLEVVDSWASREVVGLLVMMELKDGTVRFTNGCEE